MGKTIFVADIVLTIPRIEATDFYEAIGKVNSFIKNVINATPLKPMITEVVVDAYKEEEEEPTQ